MNDNILFYPYISLPDSLWTYRVLLYYDNIGIIVPNNYLNNPELHTRDMIELIRANLVQQIDPRDFTLTIGGFNENFLTSLLNQEDIDNKRLNFAKGDHLRIHVEKFDNGLMSELKRHKIANFSQAPGWYNVERKSALMLMTYLATIISVQDNRTSITNVDNIETELFVEKRSIQKLKLRNRILNDILPLPTNINITELERFKRKHQNELSKFRRKIESILIDLSLFKNDIKTFEESYELKIEEIYDEKEFWAAKMKTSPIKSIVFGSILPILLSTPSIDNINDNQLLSLLPPIVSAAYSSIKSHQNNHNLKESDFRILALVDRELSA